MIGERRRYHVRGCRVAKRNPGVRGAPRLRKWRHLRLLALLEGDANVIQFITTPRCML